MLRNESPFLRDEAIIVSTHKRHRTGTVSGMSLQGELIGLSILTVRSSITAELFLRRMKFFPFLQGCQAQVPFETEVINFGAIEDVDVII